MADNKKMLQGVAPLSLVIPTGGVGKYVYAGGLLDPAEVDTAEAERLVDEKYLRWVEVDADGLVRAMDADGNAPVESAGGAAKLGSTRDGTLSDDPEVLARREAAAAKLPADGSAPDGRAAHEVWVEYAVRSGMDRTEAEKAPKSELVAALKS